MCNVCTRDPAEVAPPPEVKSRSKIEQFKRKHNITTDPCSEGAQRAVAYQPDLLSVSTQLTKAGYDAARAALASLQDTKAYAILTRTSQPLQLLLGAAVLWLCLSRGAEAGSPRAWRALHVLAVGVHLGAQVWMTLVSGIVLYFSLPRHEFGRVQTVLFPVYYSFSAGASLLALLGYLNWQRMTGFENTSWVQISLLTCVFSIEAYVRLALVKPMLRAKHVKTQIEEAAGGGQEVGKHILGELAHCTRYMSVLRTFRAYHSSIAMGTMITLGSSLYSTMIIVDSICR